MIYNFPESNAPIRQGDIFKDIPYLYFDPSHMVKFDENGIEHQNWTHYVEEESVAAITKVEPTIGIVASQDCDTQFSNFIALFKIRPFKDVLGKTPPSSNSPKKQLDWWIKRIITDTRRERKWFYLPPDKTLGFKDRMAADFNLVFPVNTGFLSAHRARFRIGRLNPEADEHFRERIAQYYRQYPYDEWYPLSKEEFQIYLEAPSRKDTHPRPWQE